MHESIVAACQPSSAMESRTPHAPDFKRTNSVGAASKNNGRLDRVQYLNGPTFLDELRLRAEGRRIGSYAPIEALNEDVNAGDKFDTPRPLCLIAGAEIRVRNVLGQNQPCSN